MATAAYIIPHLPFVTDESFSQPFRDTGLSDELSQCYGSIAQMDASIGRLLDGLVAIGQEENTIVVFVSDNGMSAKSSSGKQGKAWSQADWKIRNLHGLRGSKALVWENGIRVPCLIRWPGKITPGKRRQLGGAEDILPTVIDLAGIDAKELNGEKAQAPKAITPEVKEVAVNHRPLSGISLRSSLEDRELTIQRPALFRIAISGKGAPREHTNPSSRKFEDHHLVLRGSRFKYHALPGGESALYDLTTDPREATDRKADFPEVTVRMSKEIRDRWDSVVATGRAFVPRIQTKK